MKSERSQGQPKTEAEPHTKATSEAIPEAANRICERAVDEISRRISDSVARALLPRIIAAISVQPRWLSIESAASYIDKTYSGMRYTLREHAKELPVVLIGGKPRIDREDIDRLCMNLKGRSQR